MNPAVPYLEDLVGRLNAYGSTKAENSDKRKRRLLLDMFGPELTAKLLGDKAANGDTGPTAGERLFARASGVDAYAAPYLTDLKQLWHQRR